MAPGRVVANSEPSQKIDNFRVAGDSPRTASGDYDGTVTFESVVSELFAQVPDLEPLYREQFPYLDDEDLPYVVFGAFLIPVLETALEHHDEERVRSICAYLEAVAVDARKEPMLDDLVGIEIGEWLPELRERKLLLSHLGPETRRVCSYHINRLPEES